MKRAAALTFLIGALTACGSSSGNSVSTPAPTSNPATDTGAAVAPATLASTPTAAHASNIVDNYDTATCADWKANDLVSYEQAFETAITVACGQIAPTQTVKRVAQVSIPTLRQNVSELGGS